MQVYATQVREKKAYVLNNQQIATHTTDTQEQAVPIRNPPAKPAAM